MKLASVEHRPWPLPDGPWLMAQTWHDLLFAHWPLKADAVRPHIPAGLKLDTFDGKAWIGVVPFRMSGVRPRGIPSIPGLSAFPELNVRTYITVDGKPGVYFFSLDAANPLAVSTARRLFFLPYFNARMSLSLRQSGVKGTIYYQSRRTHEDARSAQFVASYRPTGAVFEAAKGSLEDFLTSRYCLYTVDGRGNLYRGEIHHAPWPLQPAEAEFIVNTMASAQGIALPNVPPVLHFSRRLDVAIWLLKSV